MPIKYKLIISKIATFISIPACLITLGKIQITALSGQESVAKLWLAMLVVEVLCGCVAYICKKYYIEAIKTELDPSSTEIAMLS